MQFIRSNPAASFSITYTECGSKLDIWLKFPLVCVSRMISTSAQNGSSDSLGVYNTPTGRHTLQENNIWRLGRIQNLRWHLNMDKHSYK